MFILNDNIRSWRLISKKLCVSLGIIYLLYGISAYSSLADPENRLLTFFAGTSEAQIKSGQFTISITWLLFFVIYLISLQGHLKQNLETYWSYSLTRKLSRQELLLSSVIFLISYAAVFLLLSVTGFKIISLCLGDKVPWFNDLGKIINLSLNLFLVLVLLALLFQTCLFKLNNSVSVFLLMTCLLVTMTTYVKYSPLNLSMYLRFSNLTLQEHLLTRIIGCGACLLLVIVNSRLLLFYEFFSQKEDK